MAHIFPEIYVPWKRQKTFEIEHWLKMSLNLPSKYLLKVNDKD